MRGVVITTDGAMYAKNFEDSRPLYKTVGEAVGGFIEVVHPNRPQRPFTMIVNEEGLLMQLPTNPIGSVLYETDKHGSPIVGDVVILKDILTDEGPDIGGLTDAEVFEVMNLITKTIFNFSKR